VGAVEDAALGDDDPFARSDGDEPPSDYSIETIPCGL
jgi:hypothetical protein